MSVIREVWNLRKSFACAIRGLGSVVWTERNFRIHLIAVVVVSLSGWFFDISPEEWLAVILSMGGVLAIEVMNTALEYLADSLQPARDVGVGRAKDAAAGAVLIAALAAVTVGAIVFLPKLWEWLQKFQESNG